MSESSWRVEVDFDADAAYIRMADAEPAESVEASEEVLVDLDVNNVVVGIELLRIAAEIPFTLLTDRFHVHSADVEFLRALRPSIRARLQLASDGVNQAGRERTLEAV